MIVSRRHAACSAALLAGVVSGGLVATAPAADARSRPAAVERHLAHHASAQALQGSAPTALTAVTGPVSDSAVVYVVSTATDEGIRLRHLATGATEDVIAPIAGALFADPVISPDGSLIAYAKAADDTSPFNVYVAQLSNIAGAQRVDNSSNDQLAPDWAPDSGTLMYSQFDATGSGSVLRTVSVSGTGSTGSPTTIVLDGMEGRYAACEPNPSLMCQIADGSKIAYVIASTGELATANPDGSVETPLAVYGDYPSWSPGTDQLVYEYSKGPPGLFGLATVDLAPDASASGGENQILATTPPDVTAEYPSYSHDGSEIYFSRATLPNDFNIASVALRDRQFVADLTFQSTADDVDGHRFGPDIGHGTTSTFTAINPVRVIDTRPGAGHLGSCNALGAGGTCEFTVAPFGGVPAGANAVVLNITGIAPSSATDLRVYPKVGAVTPVPTVSNLNLAAGQTAAVAAVVKTGGTVGGPNKVVIRNAAGVTNVAVDIAGYFQNDATHDLFHALTPARIADSRNGLGCPTALGPGQVCTLTVTENGTAGLPAAATAVVFNLTGASGTAATDLRAYPGDAATVPRVSNLNLAPRTVRANLVTVALAAGSTNTVKIRNSAGTTNVIVDIAGYYTADTADPNGSFFHPVDPVRILDTRYGQKTPDGEPLRLGAGGVEQAVTHDTVTTAFGGTELASRATSLVANLTVVAPSATTDVRAYPADLTTPPQVSNINATAGASVPNLLFVATAPSGVSRGDIKLRNSSGEVSLLLDVAGFFENS